MIPALPHDPRRPRQGAGHGTRRRLRKVEETSAGGVVVDRTDGSPTCSGQITPVTQVALIGRTDRRGRLEWGLPKGHLEAGETAEDAAVREIAEETGLRAKILGALGTLDYWFVAGDHRVHKTVHHFLLQAVGGTLVADDPSGEVDVVAWVPIDEVAPRLAHAAERRLVLAAAGLLAGLA